MLATPSFIYFDLGKVLLLFDHETACRQMAELASIKSEHVREIVFEGDLQWRYERGDLTTEQFYQEFCAATNSQPELEQLLYAASDIFWPNNEIVPVVQQLRRQGLRLGILSNTCCAHWEFVSNGRFDIVNTEMFEVAALSYELNSMKPEPEIYERAAAMAGVSPQEIFFMDDRKENVTAACQAGFDAVLFEGVGPIVDDLTSRGIKLDIE